MAINIIGVAGSPRPKGNSTFLLNAVLDGAKEAGAQAERIHLNGLLFRGCQACDACQKPANDCSVKDALSPVLAKLWLADIWVLAAPIYFDGVSGQMKLFFDRCRCFYYHEGKTVKGKLEGKRRAAIILTYEDKPRKDYSMEGQKLVRYLKWMGDFGKPLTMAEGNLGPADAASKRNDLIEKARAMGRELAEGLSP